MAHHAVVFDFFGTLVNNFCLREHRQVLAQMAGILGAQPEPFIDLWIGTFNQRCTGQFASVQANILHVCQAQGLAPAPDAVREAVSLRRDYTQQHLRPRPGALDLLAALQQRRLKTGLISDCSIELPELWPTSAFAPLMDAAVFSCLVHLRKPDPRVYHLLCQRLNVQPEECLYIGDGGSQELTGALAVGMHPVLIRPAAEDPADVHRVDAEPWSGPRIESLDQVLSIIGSEVAAAPTTASSPPGPAAS